jgi:oligoribonuclease
METSNLVWVDLETGGLDEDQVPIYEVASIITDGDLNELGRFEAVVRSEYIVLTPWTLKQHGESGLLDLVTNPEVSRAPDVVERKFCEFLREHKCERAPLAGSSVHFDRRFLKKHMPQAIKLLGYRNVDVSCLTELAKRWLPEFVFVERPPKRELHRAIPDLEDSINLARYYRQFFKL